MEQRRNEPGLLGRYAIGGSQAAFSQLVERYIKLVYSTCYRELHQRELAEEATQLVFLELAQKAATIRSETGLASWLYKTALFKASVLRQKERRRMTREQHAYMEAQRSYERTEEEAWKSIEPALNDCLSTLSSQDREAILLRFFEEKSMREVGQAMGASEEAARKRVTRALSKLRSALTNRKAAAVSVAALAALLSARATYAVPAQLTASVSQSAAGVLSASAPSAGWQLFRPLNPPITKGLLLVSTTKIIAGGVAAVVVILALTFVVLRHAHSPGSVPGSTTSSSQYVTWQVAPASDPASQQAQQQIKAQFDQMASAFLSGDAQKMMAVYSPDFAADGNQNGKPVRLTYADLAKATAMMVSAPNRSAQLTVQSCSIAGNTATVEVSGHMLGKNRVGFNARKPIGWNTCQHQRQVANHGNVNAKRSRR